MPEAVAEIGEVHATHGEHRELHVLQAGAATLPSLRNLIGHLARRHVDKTCPKLQILVTLKNMVFFLWVDKF